MIGVNRMNEDLILILDSQDDITLIDDSEDDLLLIDDVPHAQHYDYYTGETTVIPVLNDDQVLETRNLVMLNDVTVKPIPIVQTSNPYGGQTVIIG